MSRFDDWEEPTPEETDKALERVLAAAKRTAEVYGPTSTLVAMPAWLLIKLIEDNPFLSRRT